ncbi:Hypothetical protein NTJ_13508 [Nesidiocoris tenuis]|uniref:Uncharacterized protein n=1 Tax=Nesidiocoris tenuis TaxID=355587 RepID=A0ABN7B8I3_9HEMI|nr:Hypothetical protein NTJ_13508 [Nesidiocoris tenuis]
MINLNCSQGLGEHSSIANESGRRFDKIVGSRSPFIISDKTKKFVETRAIFRSWFPPESENTKSPKQTTTSPKVRLEGALLRNGVELFDCASLGSSSLSLHLEPASVGLAVCDSR